MLWAFVTWLLELINYRKTHNPFSGFGGSMPGQKKGQRKKVPAGRGGGGGGGGAGDAGSRNGQATTGRATPKQAPIYGPGGDDEIDAEIIDETDDEDVSIDPDDEAEPEDGDEAGWGWSWNAPSQVEATPAAITSGGGESAGGGGGE